MDGLSFLWRTVTTGKSRNPVVWRSRPCGIRPDPPSSSTCPYSLLCPCCFSQMTLPLPSLHSSCCSFSPETLTLLCMCKFTPKCPRAHPSPSRAADPPWTRPTTTPGAYSFPLPQPSAPGPESYTSFVFVSLIRCLPRDGCRGSHFRCHGCRVV